MTIDFKEDKSYSCKCWSFHEVRAWVITHRIGNEAFLFKPWHLYFFLEYIKRDLPPRGLGPYWHVQGTIIMWWKPWLYYLRTQAPKVPDERPQFLPLKALVTWLVTSAPHKNWLRPRSLGKSTSVHSQAKKSLLGAQRPQTEHKRLLVKQRNALCQERL